MKTTEAIKITYLSSDGEIAAINVIIEHRIISVNFKNEKKLLLGQTIEINTKTTEAINTSFILDRMDYWLSDGFCNFKAIPDYYNTKIVYVSESKKYCAVSVIFEGRFPSVLAFFPNDKNQKVGDIVNLSTQFKVVLKVKKDGSAFHFLEKGICNFIIAPPKIRKASYEDLYTNIHEEDDDYYENLGNSLCEYCGDYGCSCQRDLDNYECKSDY